MLVVLNSVKEVAAIKALKESTHNTEYRPSEL